MTRVEHGDSRDVLRRLADEGMRAILIEREEEYIADIRRRLDMLDGRDSPLFMGKTP